MLVFSAKTQMLCSRGNQFWVLPSLSSHVVPLIIDGCAWVKGRWARDPLQHTFIISAFISDKNNFTTIKHMYNDSVLATESYSIAIDTRDR